MLPRSVNVFIFPPNRGQQSTATRTRCRSSTNMETESLCTSCSNSLSKLSDLHVSDAQRDAQNVQNIEKSGIIAYSYQTTFAHMKWMSESGCRICGCLIELAYNLDDLQRWEEYNELGDSPDLKMDFKFEYHLELGTSKVEYLQLTHSGETSQEHKVASRHSLRLDLLAFPGDSAANFIKGRPVDSHLATEDNFQQARKWIEECCEQHEICPSRKQTQLPTRVLDVRSLEDRDAVRLHLSSPRELAEYSALSYVWGGPQPTTLTLDTLPDMCHEIPISDLPQTIIDAIAVTRELDIRYLWIDALCIIQDSNADKFREIGQMARIYQDASVTIAAVNAKSVGEGFLVVPNFNPSDEAPNEDWFELPFGGLGTVFAQQSPLLDTYNPNDEPINKRAWTLQENLLSPRLLTFDSRCIRWDCQTHRQVGGYWPSSHNLQDHRCSRETTLFPRAIFDSSHDFWMLSDKERTRMWRNWKELVSHYSKRHLTVPEDKLFAISAIADAYAIPCGGEYLAGLWGFCLIDGLLWFVKHVDIRYSSTREEDERQLSPKYLAPSWSWASVETHGIEWLRFEPRTVMYQVEVVSYTINPVSRDVPYGALTSGSLVLSGILTKPGWSVDDKSSCIIFDHSEKNLKASRYWFDINEYYDNKSLREGVIFFLVIASDNYIAGLFLLPLGDGTYRRVGIFESDESAISSAWFDGNESTIVTIV